MRTDLGRLMPPLAAALESAQLSDREVGDIFGQVMGALVRFDHVVVFAYRGRARPIDLYSNFGEADYRVYVTLYQVGPYLLDPFFTTAHEAKRGVWRMRELAPDRFFSSEYFRTYYVQTGLAEEIGFFVPVADDVTVVLSLMRREASGPFSTGEFALLRQVDPLVAALVRRFWGGLADRFDQRPDRLLRAPADAAHALSEGVWARLGLTAREAAIIDLVLQGHSSESIGLRLAISTGTVKVHRRNVYRKLGISSQTQLLALYLKTMGPAG